MLLIWRIPFTSSMLWFPVGLVLLIALGTGMGLILMPVGILYQDVEKLLMFGLPLWMIVTPIIYPLSFSHRVFWIHWLNPAAGLLIWARDALILGTAEPMAMAIVYGVLAIPAMTIGLLAFRLSVPVLIERVPT